MFIIVRRRQNLSDVRLKTCAVDCVFYIRALWGACESTWKYRSISSNSPAQLEIMQGHDKRGEMWMSLITCVMNGLVITLEQDEIFMCLAVLVCEQFCRLANGGAKISIKSYFIRSFFFFCLSVFSSSEVLGRITSIRSKRLVKKREETVKPTCFSLLYVESDFGTTDTTDKSFIVFFAR